MSEKGFDENFCFLKDRMAHKSQNESLAEANADGGRFWKRIIFIHLSQLFKSVSAADIFDILLYFNLHQENDKSKAIEAEFALEV